MNIVVLAKQVPDSGNPRTLSEDKTVDRENADLVLNEMDEYAIEEALKIKEATEGEVTVLSVGPASATDTVRKALQMGVDKGVLVTDDAIAGSCVIGTAKVIAAALEKLGEWDMVICGAESTDGRVSVMPALVAELTDGTQLTGARKISLEGSDIIIERQVDGGYEIVKGTYPAVISVWDTINEPRYPSFKGIMAAKKKPIEEWSLADIGVDAAQVGLANATSEVLEATPRPARQAGERITDEGDGGQKLVAYLASQKLV